MARVLIVDNGSLSIEVLQARLQALGAESQVVRLADLRPDEPEAGGYDATILSGTDLPSSADVYDSELELIRRTERPLLGICGGMHLIGRAHGAGIEDCEQAVGKTPVDFRPGEPLFRGLEAPTLLFQRHRYQLSAVPDGFDLIAWGDRCRTEGLRHTDRPLYGLQAHVEFRPEGRAVLGNFLRLS